MPFRIAESGAISAVDDVRSFERNPPTPSSLFERPSASRSSSVGTSPAPPDLSAKSSPSADAKIRVPNAVGGKWTFETSEDTDAPYRLFVLRPDTRVTDGFSADFPSFILLCGMPDSPRWINSKLLSPVVLGAGDQKSALGVPQQSVQLRAYRKIHLHFWNIAEDHKTLFVDKGATNELINSADARIAFRDAGGMFNWRIFRPSA